MSLCVEALAALAAILVACGFVAVVLAVFYRYFLGTPLNGVDELTGYLVIAIMSFGFGSALLLDHHIGVDILTGLVGRRASRALNVWSGLCVLLCAVLLGWSAWHTVEFNRDFGTYSTGGLEVPIWLAQAPMIPGAIFLGLAALIRTVRAFKKETE